jgi:hypothetical protein
MKETFEVWYCGCVFIVFGEKILGSGLRIWAEGKNTYEDPEARWKFQGNFCC